jgi:hypothetical protein
LHKSRYYMYMYMSYHRRLLSIQLHSCILGTSTSLVTACIVFCVTFSLPTHAGLPILQPFPSWEFQHNITACIHFCVMLCFLFERRLASQFCSLSLHGGLRRLETARLCSTSRAWRSTLTLATCGSLTTAEWTFWTTSQPATSVLQSW